MAPYSHRSAQTIELKCAIAGGAALPDDRAWGVPFWAAQGNGIFRTFLAACWKLVAPRMTRGKGEIKLSSTLSVEYEIFGKLGCELLINISFAIS